MAERIYTTDQVEKLLGATPAVLEDWINRGWLPADRMPDGTVLVTQGAIVRFLRGRGINIEDVMAKTVVRQSRSSAPPGPACAGLFDSAPLAAASASRAEAGRPPARTEPPPAPPVTQAPAPPPAKHAPEPPESGATDRAVQDADKAAPVRAARQVLDAILQDAAERQAAAIHLEWQPDGLTLRLRIGGRLHEKPNFKARLPKPIRASLLAQCKLLAGLDPNETLHPQSGSTRRQLLGRDFGLRVSTCPTVSGENVVIHIAERAAPPSLHELGLPEADLAVIQEALATPSGLIAVSALPREDGDRTLLAMAATAAAQGRGAIRIGLPSEDAAAGAITTIRAPLPGLTTAGAILAAMSQDADVIEVAGVGDRETAHAVTSAAAAGHLVLAGFQSRWPSTDPTSLVSAGAEPRALAATLLAIIAQKKVRRVCAHCRTTGRPDGEILARIVPHADAGISATSAGLGCDRCGHTGYLGESNLYAVLAVDEDIARMIAGGAAGRAILDAARRSGSVTLREAALEQIRAGLISPEEAARALGL
jgi:type II secretory ATPase GspE/PulE/Tfp pilus assembly ATPase PilB-like protein